jgi:hypothetical protein
LLLAATLVFVLAIDFVKIAIFTRLSIDRHPLDLSQGERARPAARFVPNTTEEQP